MKANLLILLLFFMINFSFAQSFNEVKKVLNKEMQEHNTILGLSTLKE
jgi:hypothetical protein